MTVNPAIPRAILDALQEGPMTSRDLVAAIDPKAGAAATSAVWTALDEMSANGIIRRQDGKLSLTDYARTLIAARYSGLGAGASAKAARHALDAIEPLAKQLVTDLEHLAIRLQIGGSIRRRKPDVGDIELVALVHPEASLLPAAAPVPDMRLTEALKARADTVVRSGHKHTQVIIQDPDLGPVTVDLWQTHKPECWGRLLFVRTGSSDFVKRADAYYKQHSGGRITDLRYYDADGQPQPTFSERDVFTLLDHVGPARVPYVPPERRTPK